MSESAPQSVRSSASNHGRIVTENPSLLSLLKEKTDDNLNRKTTHTHGGARSHSRNQESQNSETNSKITNKHVTYALDSGSSHKAENNLDNSRVASNSIADIAEDNIYKGQSSKVKAPEEDSALDLGFDSPAPEAGLETYRVPSPVSQVIPFIESPNNFRNSSVVKEDKLSGEEKGRKSNSPTKNQTSDQFGDIEGRESVSSIEDSIQNKKEAGVDKSGSYLHPELGEGTPRHVTPRHERFSAGRTDNRSSTSQVYAVANPAVLVAQGDTPTQQNVQFTPRPTPRVQSSDKVQSPTKSQTNDETGEINEQLLEKPESGKSGKNAHVSFNDPDINDRDSPLSRDDTPTNWDTARRSSIQDRVPTPHPSSPRKTPVQSYSPTGSPKRSAVVTSEVFSPEPVDSIPQNLRDSPPPTVSDRHLEREISKHSPEIKSEKTGASLSTVQRVYVDSPTFTRDEENEYRFVESRLETENEELDKTFRELDNISPKRRRSANRRSGRKHSGYKTKSGSKQIRKMDENYDDDRYDDRRVDRGDNYGDQYEGRDEERGSYGEQYERRSNHARDTDRENDHHSDHHRDNDQYDRRSDHHRDSGQQDRRSNHDQHDRRSDHGRDNDRGYDAERDERNRRQSYDRYQDRDNDRDRRQSVEDRFDNRNDQRDRRQSLNRYEERDRDVDRDRHQDRDRHRHHDQNQDRDRGHDDQYRNHDRYEDRNAKMEDSRSRHSGGYQHHRNQDDRRRDDDTPTENYIRRRDNTNVDDDLEREKMYQTDLRHRIDSQSKKDSEFVVPKLPLNMESEDYVQDSLDYEPEGNTDWGNPPPNPYGGYDDRGMQHGGYQRTQPHYYSEQQDGYHSRPRGVQEYIDQLDTARMEIVNPRKPKYDYVENNKIDYGRVHDKSYRKLVEKRKEAEEKLDKIFVSPKNKPKQQRQLNKVTGGQYYNPLADFHNEHQMSGAEEMWAQRSAALSKKKSKTASGTIKKTTGLQKYPSDSGLFRIPGQTNGVRMYGTPTRNHFLEPMGQRPMPPPGNDPYGREPPPPQSQVARSPPFKKPLELKPITQQIVTEDGQRISVDINLKVVSPPPPHSQVGGPPQIEAEVIPRSDMSPERRPTGQQYQLPYRDPNQADMMTTYGQYEDQPPLPPPQYQQQPQYGGPQPPQYGGPQQSQYGGPPQLQYGGPQQQYGSRDNIQDQPHYQQGYYGYDDAENVPPPSNNMDANQQNTEGEYGHRYSPYNIVPPINLDPESDRQLGHFDEHGYAAMYKKEKEKENTEGPWYQVYTVKDYRKMVKEVKLNRGTLGPDLDNETYKEKLEKRYKQIDYARMVMEKNRQDYGDRKPPAFPKPKDHNKEEARKRQAALDYAKNVPKPNIKQKANQYNSYEIASQLSPVNKRKSPVQKMPTQTIDVIDLKKLQQRHEQDKQSVAAIRQNVEA